MVAVTNLLAIACVFAVAVKAQPLGDRCNNIQTGQYSTNSVPLSDVLLPQGTIDMEIDIPVIQNCVLVGALASVCGSPVPPDAVFTALDKLMVHKSIDSQGHVKITAYCAPIYNRQPFSPNESPKTPWDQTPQPAWGQSPLSHWGQSPQSQWGQSPQPFWGQPPQPQRGQSPQPLWGQSPPPLWGQ